MFRNGRTEDGARNGQVTVEKFQILWWRKKESNNTRKQTNIYNKDNAIQQLIMVNLEKELAEAERQLREVEATNKSLTASIEE